MIKHCQITQHRTPFYSECVKMTRCVLKSTLKCLTLEFQHSNFCCALKITRLAEMCLCGAAFTENTVIMSWLHIHVIIMLYAMQQFNY